MFNLISQPASQADRPTYIRQACGLPGIPHPTFPSEVTCIELWRRLTHSSTPSHMSCTQFEVGHIGMLLWIPSRFLGPHPSIRSRFDLPVTVTLSSDVIIFNPSRQITVQRWLEACWLAGQLECCLSSSRNVAPQFLLPTFVVNVLLHT